MKKDPDRHGDNGHVTSEAETTVLQLEAKERQGTPREADEHQRLEGRILPPGVFSGRMALPVPGFGTHSLQNREMTNFCCFNSPSLRRFVTAALETDILA